MCPGEEIKNEPANDRPLEALYRGRQQMTTRRNFLKGAAATGIAFCSCGMLDAARAQQPKAARLPVKINGKRVMNQSI
jgi:TAT (twin-arginine translocation) pathway signal sequence